MSENAPRWRIGRRVPRNIYKDNEPIAMLATPEIAKEIVDGMNEVERLRQVIEELAQAADRVADGAHAGDARCIATDARDALRTTSAKDDATPP